MPAVTFDDLWEKSLLFRNLFVGEDRVFLSHTDFDREVATKLWEARRPRINWNFCAQERCSVLVEDGAYCGKHSNPEDGLPTWRWSKKVLFKHRSAPHHRKGEFEYRDYLKQVAYTRFGSLPAGYHVIQKDGNPFNFKHTNILLLSKIAVAAVQAGVMGAIDAFEMDGLLSDFIAEKFKAGRRPVAGIIAYSDIGYVMQIHPATVSKNVKRGNLDIEDLGSVVKFVNNAKKVDNSA